VTTLFRDKLIFPISMLVLAGLACSFLGSPVTTPSISSTPASNPSTAPIQQPSSTTGTQGAQSPASPTVTSASPANQPATVNSDEPVFISGEIPYTNPFFLNSTAEPFVMLEDEAGFVRRDTEFRFNRKAQQIGPVDISADKKLTYSLSLPEVPQATQVDVDNNGKTDAGVQVFAVAYWSNTWGDPFLEDRDGKGWSTAYTSAIVDPEKSNEIVGGTLVIWAPDDQQGFPSGFGPDGKLFTADDPITKVPAGYSLVDLSQPPFRFYKEAHPQLTLNEGVIAVKDFSNMNYADAFKAMFDRVSLEYPFTKEKNVDWAALYKEFAPRIAQATSSDMFSRVLRDFANSIPDEHIGVPGSNDAFYAEYGGGFGLILTELSDGKIIASQVLPGFAAEKANIQPGAEILTWNGLPVAQAVENVAPGFGPYSSQHTKHLSQVQFLTRVAPDSQVSVTFSNPGAQPQSVTLQADKEYASLLKTVPAFNQDSLALPIEGRTLDSGLGYLRINTFSSDDNLMAHVWDHNMQTLIDEKVPGLIIDLRSNSGGSMGLALNFAGYFFDKEINLFSNYYYNENSGTFEKSPYPTRILPAPLHYSGPIALLVGPDCVSACEGFAYALQQNQRAIVVGHYPSAGAFGEVGRGQYKLPDNIDVQFPTGKSITADGKVVIEGSGVIPDILVPVTAESALSKTDDLLQAAIQALQQRIP
jgi:C-terminal processing protease CtpA/Prc